MTGFLPTLAAPPVEEAAEEFRFTGGFGAQLRKKRIGRRRPLFLLGRGEGDADRDRDAFAADDAFAVAQRRDRIDEAACARSEEHTSELQSLMRISYAVFCLKKKTHDLSSTTNTKYFFVNLFTYIQ